MSLSPVPDSRCPIPPNFNSDLGLGTARSCGLRGSSGSSPACSGGPPVCSGCLPACPGSPRCIPEALRLPSGLPRSPRQPPGILGGSSGAPRLPSDSPRCSLVPSIVTNPFLLPLASFGFEALVTFPLLQIGAFSFELLVLILAWPPPLPSVRPPFRPPPFVPTLCSLFRPELVIPLPSIVQGANIDTGLLSYFKATGNGSQSTQKQ